MGCVEIGLFCFLGIVSVMSFICTFIGIVEDSKSTNSKEKMFMSSNCLYLQINALTTNFRSRFRVHSYTDSYVHFVANTCSDIASVCVYRTSEKCFRVMFYHSHLQNCKVSDYKSFRTLSELCYYLDTLSFMLV